MKSGFAPRTCIEKQMELKLPVHKQLYQDQVIFLYHNNMHNWYMVRYLIINGMNLAI